MKKYIIIIILFQFYGIKAQKKDSLSTDYDRIYVEFGQIIPLGTLKKQFDQSLHYGFWLRTKIKHNNYWEVGFNFYIPKNAQPVQVFEKGSNHIFKSAKFNFSFGGRLSKVIELSKNTNIDWVTGFGVKLYPYSIPNTLILTEEEKEKRDGNVIFQPYLAQGLRFNYKNIGLQVHYHYGVNFQTLKLTENFGNSYLTFGVVYRQ